MKDLDFVLASLQTAARRQAIFMPTAQRPPEPKWSEVADNYVQIAAETEELPRMTPEVAAALLPRIVCARKHAAETQRKLDETLGREATAGELLNELLFTRWHAAFHKEWLKGSSEEG